MNKTDLSERDICTKFITPAVKQAGWDLMSQVREEVSFTKGRIIVRGTLVGPTGFIAESSSTMTVQGDPSLTCP